MELADLTIHAKIWLQNRATARFCVTYTRVLAALGSVVAGIRHSCSGYAGSRPWLLAAGRRADARWHPSRPGKHENARRSTIYARFCFLSRVSLGRAVPAPTGEALKARDRRATPAAAARRFIQRTKVQRPGAAAAPTLDSPPVRPSQAWAWRFFCLKEASHHTVRVASHARGHAWHSFYYLVFSIPPMRLPSRFDKRHAKIWFCRFWREKKAYFC